jgi:hypothetical protein
VVSVDIRYLISIVVFFLPYRRLDPSNVEGISLDFIKPLVCKEDRDALEKKRVEGQCLLFVYYLFCPGGADPDGFWFSVTVVCS